MAFAQRREEPIAQPADLRASSALRRRIQLGLWAIVAITIIAGPFCPLIGFVVPVVMLTGILGGFFKGRYVCGWLCPRGAFYDRIIRPISPGRAIPDWLRTPIFRWSVFALLMGFMAWRVGLNPADLHHWGRVFVHMCMITTGLGVILALLLHPRTWCAFCPIGTFQSAVGKRKSPLHLEPGCLECKSCERACPMNLKIVGRDEDGRLDLPDCVKCPECQLACPKNLLHF